MTLREKLLGNLHGCTNHNCVVRKPKGMGTNGSCHCLQNLSRCQLNILTSRIEAACKQDEEVE